MINNNIPYEYKYLNKTYTNIIHNKTIFASIIAPIYNLSTKLRLNFLYSFPKSPGQRQFLVKQCHYEGVIQFPFQRCSMKNSP